MHRARHSRTNFTQLVVASAVTQVGFAYCAATLPSRILNRLARRVSPREKRRLPGATPTMGGALNTNGGARPSDGREDVE